MTSVESAKSYEATYNDAECQEMYEASMGELAAEETGLQKEVKAGPKTNEDAKNFIKRGKINLLVNYIDNYRGLDSEVAETLIKRGYKDSVLSHLESFNCDKIISNCINKK